MKINGNIIAHRGIHDNKETPENSLKAFKKALRKNIPIELDVQLTKDNILVVFHDYSLFRMTGKKAYLQDLNYKELQELNLLNTNEKIPTLKEVLDLIQDKVLIDIEVKNSNSINTVCTLLQEELVNYNNYILKSFNPIIVKKLKKYFPNKEIGFLINDHYSNYLYDKISTSTMLLNFINPDFIAISKKLLKTKKINYLEKKYPVLVWTITNKEEIEKDDKIYICNNLEKK